ncbi:hypothetical protein H5T58_00115 [Candidatus Parcubacteria bacterium]|nr:hypothetical protein [Candidatus Parcubacteria bacterium]
MQKEKTKHFKLNLEPGTRLTSFLYIAFSVLIAAGILFGASIYYDIDTGQIITENVYKAVQLIKATAGLVVGADKTPTSGYGFEVTTSTLFSSGELVLSQTVPLKFLTGSYSIAFQAPSSGVTTSTTYYWPQTPPPAGQTYILAADDTGQMQWISPTEGGLAGDIYAVGDVDSGNAFTQTGSGSTLWFHSGSYTGALTIGSLSANATYTLPSISGTGILTVASSFPFSPNQVLYADSSGLITGGADLTFDASSKALTIGSSGNLGELRIYSSGTNYLAFKPGSLTQNATYIWPGYPDSSFKVLTSDTSGNLSWQTVAGVGGVTGSGSAGQVAYWDGSSSITGDAGFTYDATNDTLTVAGAIITQTLKSNSGDLTLDSASGIIALASGDYIQTSGGYEIGKQNTEILKEMIPIMGFDLPVYTATTSYVQVSRDIESYPFGPCAGGTSRVHKLVVRYAAKGSSQASLRIGTTEYSLPLTGSDLSKGSVRTIEVTIPQPGGTCTSWTQGTDVDDWKVEVKNESGGELMIYQIFLAAYDKIL